MKIILDKNKLIKFINNEKNLGFVPTLGAIHPGHAFLIKKSVRQCNKTVVSIFVNKPQFNNKNDFRKYPRNLKRDIKILKNLKVDYLYIPSEKQIYPNGPNRNIKISPLEKKLCGKNRPGHFRAVVDVVDRFIKIIKPKKIFLGEKDMQQLKIIEHFVKKKYKKVIIVPCKTIRENEGIAFSSRNFLLKISEKRIASKIYKLLLNKKKMLIKGKLSLNKLSKEILNFGIRKIDYIKIIDINKLIKPFKTDKKYKIFISYYIRSIRLIDNI